MGIPEFLSKVLESAGRKIDLRDYAEHGILKMGTKRRRRPLRIGIDVSSWVYKAAHGFGDMLGDERHLTNYGRQALVNEQQQATVQRQPNTNNVNVEEYVASCTHYILKRLETLRTTSQADLLVVFDGKTPPVKLAEVERRRSLRQEHERQREEAVDPNADPTVENERRTKAFRRAGAGRHFSQIIDALMETFRSRQISFMVAPYEADSQLAYLSHQGYLDLIITEDSDLVAHGAKAMLYKSVSELGDGKPVGYLLQYSNLGAVAKSLNLVDFTPLMMAVLFVAVGCDYCDKLKGIGLVTASRIVRQALLEPSSSMSSSPSPPLSSLAQVFSQLYQQSYARTYSDDFKKGYEERFLAALVMYRHPIVYDIMERQCVIADNLLDGGDADMMDHEPYAALCRDPDRIQEIVGVLPSLSDSTTVVVEGKRDRLATSEASQQNDKDDSQEEPPAANPTTQDTTQAHNNENEDDDDADLSQDESAANHPATQEEQAQNENEDDDMSQEDPASQPVTQDQQAQNESADEDDDMSQEEPTATQIMGQAQNEDNVDMSQEDPVANLATQEEDAQNSHHSSQQEDDGEAPLTQEPDLQHRVDGKRRSRWKKGKKKKNGGLVVLGEDSDGTVSFKSDGTTQSQEGSVNDTTTMSMEARSPNLLYSSTPEKTIASQKSAQTSSTSKSPNLLYSSTPEKTTPTSQSQEEPSRSSV
jgi:5'-3' exonuclease